MIQKFFLAIFFIGTILLSQNITNEEIWQFKFFPKGISGIESMNDGEHYSVLSQSGIEQYSYKTFQKVKTLVSGTFTDYEFNADESWLLLETESDPVFRYSVRGEYELYNVNSGKKYSVFNGDKVQEPTISPDGEKVAFMADDNNLYYQEIESGEIVQITKDGKVNSIKNGITDWVYEEEFGYVRAFDWNGNSNKIAFIRFDESEVPEMGIDIYGKELYQTNLTFKYPKAGEKNSEVSVHVYDLKSKNTTDVDLSSYQDFYIPKIAFNHVGEKDANDLFVFISNRHQNKVDVWKVDVASNKKEKLFTETDEAYIETDHLTFELISPPGNVETNTILWVSERDGFKHAYLLDYDTGKVRKQLTKGNWEVTDVYGYDADLHTLYYQSTEPGSTNRGVYAIDINGNKKNLTPDLGVSNAEFSKSFQYFINQYSTFNEPPLYTLNKGKDGSILAVLEDNQQLKQLQKEKNVSEVEFSEINVNNTKLNAWLMKPKDFNPNKKYPLFMFQYSGPGSQQVIQKWNTFNYWWFQSLAQQGYIVACVDGRGTSGKGSEFKKTTYKQLGKYEIEDQIAAAKYFGNLEFIDANRIGIFGWSYGGYMTLLALTKGADVFKAGIAVAPVTNWLYYDTIYTERFMRTPQENPDGYVDNSPINHAEKLKGELLLIHGSGDDNVHVQNTMQMVEALVQQNKEFDLFIYPDKNHGIFGGNTRLHLYNKMTNFILENL